MATRQYPQALTRDETKYIMASALETNGPLERDQLERLVREVDACDH